VEILSWTFVGFTTLVWVIYIFLPHRVQNIWLLLASYVFYLYWNIGFTVVLVISTLVNYFVAHRLQQSQQLSRRWLWLGIGGNVLALCIFRMAVSGYGARLTGLLLRNAESSPIVNLDILLPIGFSFYTLGAISYLVDVYRKQEPPSSNLVDFALYMAYFPKMIAGPIERARTFLPQIAQSRILENDNLKHGIGLIVIGMLRKIVIAGTLSRGIPENLFVQTAQFSTGTLATYLVMYAFWLYNDFAGYTNIVRGVSKLFGIQLTRNFQQPYFARSFNEFWNRWHISLSHWLRDYIYFPLSRKLRRGHSAALNIIAPPMVTMLVSGLWHNFGIYMLVWGGLHGVFQVFERLLTVWKPKWMIFQQQPAWKNLLRMLIVFILTCLAWVAFGSGSFSRAIAFWIALLSGNGEVIISSLSLVGGTLVILLCLFMDGIQYFHRDELVFLTWKRFQQAALLAFVMLIFLLNSLLGEVVVTPFVYQGF
jgi:alginate O-acetyltransferase complex protein AlgI